MTVTLRSTRRSRGRRLAALLPFLVAGLSTAPAARAQTVVPVPVGGTLVLKEAELRPDSSTVGFFGPSFAPRPGGGFLAGWARVVQGGAEPEPDRIEIEAFNHLDRQVGPTRLVSDEPDPPTDPQRSLVLAASGGRAIAVWQSFEGGGAPTSVLLRVLNSVGQPTSDQVTAGTSGAGLRPGVALAPSGRALVAWTQFAAGVFDLRGRIFDAQGNAVTGELALDGGFGASGVPSVGVDEDGRFLVAWTGGDDGIYAHWLDADGQTVVPAFQVAGGPAASDPGAAVAPDGAAVVVWSECDEDSPGQVNSCEVRFRLLGTDGLPLGPSQRASALDGRLHEQPAVGAADDGDFALAWRACQTSNGFDRFDCLVTTSFHDPSGDRYGNRLQKERDGEPDRFTVVPLGDDFVVGWFRFSCDSQTCDPGLESVYAQRYRLIETGGAQADDVFPDVPDDAPVLTSPEFEDFRFRVRIGRPGSEIFGVQEPACLPETICVSGALPGRAEIFLRVIGPRPNGFLWPTIVKFTTSTVEVWIEQVSTGEVQYYGLDGATQGSSELPGLFDRTGFQP